MQRPQQQAARPLYWTRTEFLFHCHFKIKIPLFYPENILDELFEEIKRIDKLYNSFQPQSYFWKINQYAGDWVNVDQTTIALLDRTIEMSDYFDGQYDISITPLLRLWHFFDEEKKQIPRENEILEILDKVNYKNIEINNDKVKIAKGMELTTGSFLKSFAVDCIVDQLKNKYKITDALVNAGGSTIYAINDETHPYWKVNIQDVSNQKENIATIKLSNTSINISAQNQSFVEINATQFGHIIHPKTGQPSTNKQVAVITRNACLGDMLSTGLLCIMDNIKETMENLEKKYQASSLLTDFTNNEFTSSKFSTYKL